MTYLVNILSILAVSLFALNYPIADYILPYSVDYDGCTAVRFNIYALSILCFAICSKLSHTTFSKTILTIGIGFCASDCIDRFIFNETHFKKLADTIMILTTTIFAIWKLRK